jgi:hypothetical protein
MNTQVLVTLAVLGAGSALFACGGSDQKPAEDPSSTIVTTTSATPAAPDPAATTSPAPTLPSMAPYSSPSSDTTTWGKGTSTDAPTNSAGVSAGTPTAPPPSVFENPGSADHTADADNTRINARDKNGGTLTPVNQGNAETDRKITAAVRRAVVADRHLSLTAKNIKVITQYGKVTLRGTVKSDTEKAKIEQHVKDVSGVTEVDDQLEVKP